MEISKGCAPRTLEGGQYLACCNIWKVKIGAGGEVTNQLTEPSPKKKYFYKFWRSLRMNVKILFPGSLVLEPSFLFQVFFLGNHSLPSCKSDPPSEY